MEIRVHLFRGSFLVHLYGFCVVSALVRGREACTILFYGVIKDLIPIQVVWTKLAVAFHSLGSERVKGERA